MTSNPPLSPLVRRGLTALAVVDLAFAGLLLVEGLSRLASITGAADGLLLAAAVAGGNAVVLLLVRGLA